MGEERMKQLNSDERSKYRNESYEKLLDNATQQVFFSTAEHYRREAADIKRLLR